MPRLFTPSTNEWKQVEDALAATCKSSIEFAAAVHDDEEKEHILFIVLGFRQGTSSEERGECTRALFEELLTRGLLRRVLEADDPCARYHARVMSLLHENEERAFKVWQYKVLSQSKETEQPDSDGVQRLAMELRELAPEKFWVPSNRVLARGRQAGRVSANLTQENLVQQLGDLGFTYRKAAQDDGSAFEGRITDYEALRDGQDLKQNEYKIYLTKVG